MYRCCCCCAAAVAALAAAAQGVEGSETRGAAGPAWLTPLEPTTVLYRWRVLTPHVSVEPRTVGARVHAPALRAARVDFDVVEWTSERRKLGRVAGFHCKYSDFWLPNSCHTTWHDLHVDVPVPVVRRGYADVDVPVWSSQTWQATIDVPRLVWTEETLVVTLPAFAARAAQP